LKLIKIEENKIFKITKNDESQVNVWQREGVASRGEKSPPNDATHSGNKLFNKLIYKHKISLDGNTKMKVREISKQHAAQVSDAFRKEKEKGIKQVLSEQIVS
jgi:hypothetical protein